MSPETVGTIIGLTLVAGAVAFVSFMALCLVCAGTLAVVIPIRVGLWALRLVRTELDATIPVPDPTVNTEVCRLDSAAEEYVWRDPQT
jgi:hypothetical protein